MAVIIAMQVHTTALVIFCFFFLFVTVAGFWAARWRRPEAGLHSLEEWGLAGRSFGTWISWFLIGGDLYTAYTVVAVPAVLFGTGAFGFFAVPYAVIAYPYMMVVLPKLWKVCHRHGYITFADFVRGRYDSRWLAVAVAVTGILALMPYIALQLVGMRVVLEAIGLGGEIPLIVAFAILAIYTYSSGLRAPAIIAIVKDIMLYVMVLTALIYLPWKLGGYGHVFSLANQALATHKTPGSIFLKPAQYLPYSSLAIGSALALMLYPHTATAVLSARSVNTVRRNAAMLPAYSFLLGLIALLGYVALAAGVTVKDVNAAVPQLFVNMFPEWFAGFCLAAVAVGALVPAAIMSIAAANLFTRSLLNEFLRNKLTPRGESTAAKIVSLAVKFGALAFVLELPTDLAIELQLLGGIWTGQIFPAVVLGCFTRWFRPWALFTGWLAGMVCGTWMASTTHFKSSIFPLHLFGQTYAMYAAVPALLLNLTISVVLTLILRAIDSTEPADFTTAEDYAA